MSDYLQRRKALREKFFPPVRNVVERRAIRGHVPLFIYSDPIGPERPPRGTFRTGGRLLYSRPIGPTMVDAVVLAEPVYEHPSTEWVARAFERGLINARLECPLHVKSYICKSLVECCVDWKTVRSDSRLKEAQIARRLISYWLHVYCGMTTSAIGQLMMKDHSSVVVAIRRYRQEMALQSMGAVQ